MKKLSVIIPCFNEVKTIEEVLTRVKAAKLPEGWAKEIVVVDDCSNDGTREFLKKYNNGIVLALNDVNLGKGGALKKGLEVASGDYIMIQDADSEYNPDEYINLLRPISENRAFIVFGSRNLKSNNVPFSQIYFYGGMLLTKIFNILFRSRLTDITTCYKVFPKNLIPQLIRYPHNDFVFDAVELTYELVSYGGILEVPISYKARSKAEGKKLNWRHGARVFFAMLKMRLNLDLLIRKLRFGAIARFIKKDSVVVDVGCGSTYPLLRYFHSTFKIGYGLDRRAYQAEFDNIKILPFDLEFGSAIPLQDNSVDQIFMLAVLEHLSQPKVVLQKLRRVLKNDGQIILTTPTKLAKPILEFLAYSLKVVDAEEIKEHKHYFGKHELIDLLMSAGFKNVRHKYFELGVNQRIIAEK